MYTLYSLLISSFDWRVSEYSAMCWHTIALYSVLLGLAYQPISQTHQKKQKLYKSQDEFDKMAYYMVCERLDARYMEVADCGGIS